MIYFKYEYKYKKISKHITTYNVSSEYLYKFLKSFVSRPIKILIKREYKNFEQQ